MKVSLGAMKVKSHLTDFYKQISFPKRCLLLFGINQWIYRKYDGIDAFIEISPQAEVLWDKFCEVNHIPRERARLEADFQKFQKDCFDDGRRHGDLNAKNLAYHNDTLISIDGTYRPTSTFHPVPILMVPYAFAALVKYNATKILELNSGKGELGDFIDHNNLSTVLCFDEKEEDDVGFAKRQCEKRAQLSAGISEFIRSHPTCPPSEAACYLYLKTMRDDLLELNNLVFKMLE